MNQFSITLRVYIEDTDAGGIVYYVNYLKFFERARTELFRQLGFDKAAFVDHDKLFVVHAADIQYIKPARLDDQLLVTAKLVRRKRLSMRFFQEIYLGEQLLTTANIAIACVYKDSMKPAIIPADILQAIDYNLAVE